MWLLILAIVILVMSALQIAYYLECMTKASYKRPLLFMKHEMFLIYSNIIFLIAGFIMLFISIGWWGFAGLAIYWLLVVFVLLPIGMQRLLLILFFREPTLPYANGEEMDLDIKAMSDSDLLALKKKYKGNKSIEDLVNGILEARTDKTKKS